MDYTEKFENGRRRLRKNKGKDFRHASNARWEDIDIDKRPRGCNCERCQSGRLHKHRRKIDPDENLRDFDNLPN